MWSNLITKADKQAKSQSIAILTLKYLISDLFWLFTLETLGNCAIPSMSENA